MSGDDAKESEQAEEKTTPRDMERMIKALEREVATVLTFETENHEGTSRTYKIRRDTMCVSITIQRRDTDGKIRKMPGPPRDHISFPEDELERVIAALQMIAKHGKIEKPAWLLRAMEREGAM